MLWRLFSFNLEKYFIYNEEADTPDKNVFISLVFNAEKCYQMITIYNDNLWLWITYVQKQIFEKLEKIEYDFYSKKVQTKIIDFFYTM